MRTSQKIITRSVAWHFSMDPSELFSPKRDFKAVYPRQILFWFCRKYTGSTLAKIGRYGNYVYGSKVFDHSTVIHSVRAIENLISIRERETVQIISEIDYTIKGEVYFDNELVPMEVDLLEKSKGYTESFVDVL